MLSVETHTRRYFVFAQSNFEIKEKFGSGWAMLKLKWQMLGKERKGDLWFRVHINVNKKKLLYWLREFYFLSRNLFLQKLEQKFLHIQNADIAMIQKLFTESMQIIDK